MVNENEKEWPNDFIRPLKKKKKMKLRIQRYISFIYQLWKE